MYFVKIKTKEDLAILAIFVLIASILLTFGFYSADNELFLFILVLISFIVRVFSSVKASKQAKLLHRSDVFWTLFTFLTPPLGLIILVVLPQRIPAKCSELYKEIIEKFKAESKIIETRYNNNEISNDNYFNDLNALEDKYNRLLTELIDLKTIEFNNQVKEYYNAIDRIGGIPVIGDNDNTNYRNLDNEANDNKSFESCPACAIKLDGYYSECPECGLNLK